MSMEKTGRDPVEMGVVVVILGCAGKARDRERSEPSLGVPVVDPARVAVGMALPALGFDCRTMSQ